jgi:hypothetical protein
MRTYLHCLNFINMSPITLDTFTNIPLAPEQRHEGTSKDKQYEAITLGKGALCRALFIYL